MYNAPAQPAAYQLLPLQSAVQQQQLNTMYDQQSAVQQQQLNTMYDQQSAADR